VYLKFHGNIPKQQTNVYSVDIKLCYFTWSEQVMKLCEQKIIWTDNEMHKKDSSDSLTQPLTEYGGPLLTSSNRTPGFFLKYDNII